MQYDAQTPSEYMDQLDDDWRKEKVSQLRQMITVAGPELEEGIQYKMLSYKGSDRSVFHLNAQKNYVSLYVGDTRKVDPHGELLQGIDKGKGCLRFKKSTDLQKTQIDRFIKKTVDLWKEGKDIYC